MKTTVNKRPLEQIANEHPALIFQNNGYQYINKSKLNDSDLSAINEVSELIKSVFPSFSEFFNFRYDKDGNLDFRINYAWDCHFTGVGYFSVKEFDRDIKEMED